MVLYIREECCIWLYLKDIKKFKELKANISYFLIFPVSLCLDLIGNLAVGKSPTAAHHTYILHSAALNSILLPGLPPQQGVGNTGHKDGHQTKQPLVLSQSIGALHVHAAVAEVPKHTCITVVEASTDAMLPICHGVGVGDCVEDKSPC